MLLVLYSQCAWQAICLGLGLDATAGIVDALADVALIIAYITTALTIRLFMCGIYHFLWASARAQISKFRSLGLSVGDAAVPRLRLRPLSITVAVSRCVAALPLSVMWRLPVCGYTVSPPSGPVSLAIPSRRRAVVAGLQRWKQSAGRAMIIRNGRLWPGLRSAARRRRASGTGRMSAFCCRGDHDQLLPPLVTKRSIQREVAELDLSAVI